MKAANVRFYFDADVLGLGKMFGQLRTDCTYPSDPGGTVHKRARGRCVITDTSTPDDVWIPIVARERWLAITRDSKILEHKAEIDAVRTSAGRLVAISGKDSVGLWHQLEVLMTNWGRIEDLMDLPGPFVYRLTLRGLTPVNLEDPLPRRRRA